MQIVFEATVTMVLVAQAGVESFKSSVPYRLRNFIDKKIG